VFGRNVLGGHIRALMSRIMGGGKGRKRITSDMQHKKEEQ